LATKNTELSEGEIRKGENSKGYGLGEVTGVIKKKGTLKMTQNRRSCGPVRVRKKDGPVVGQKRGVGNIKEKGFTYKRKKWHKTSKKTSFSRAKPRLISAEGK